ncbi:MAG: PLP-dependent aminotransferase family protein [Pseudomonadales bacterium]
MHLTLDGQGTLTDQLSRALREAIRSGRAAPGLRLPASRSLAATLGVSRNVVMGAFAQLTAEGYLEARQGSGTRVAPGLAPLAPPHRPSAPVGPSVQDPVRLSALGRRLRASPSSAPPPALAAPATICDFRYGIVPFTGPARQAWSRRLGRRARGAGAAAAAPRQGDRRLRRLIADMLRFSRGLPVAGEAVVITQGVQEAFDLCARLLLGPEQVTVLEDPHYRPVRAIAAAHGAEVIGVPADAAGLDPEHLPAIDAALAYVTPSHQFPLGGVLAAPRRQRLLSWARQHGAWVFEDDYDSHFRYDTPPLESLAAMDRSRVIYAGSFSKTLSPGLRVGYLVVPDARAEPLRRLRALTGSGVPLVTQQALADFIDAGDFGRHLRRLGRDYARRREAILQATADHLGDRVEVVGARGGVHVVLRCHEHAAADAHGVTTRAAAAGVRISSIEALYLQPRPDQPLELLLSYAAPDERAIRAGIAALAGCLRT